MSKPSDEAVGGSAVLLVLVVVAGAFCVRWHHQQEEKKAEHQRVLDWTNKSIPDVQSAIDGLGLEITQRVSKLDDLRRTCGNLDIDPEQDPDYQRWNREAWDLTHQRDRLIWARNDAFIENFKAGLDSDPQQSNLCREKADQALSDAYRAKETIQSFRGAPDHGSEQSTSSNGESHQ